MAGLRLLGSLVIIGFLAAGCSPATTPTSVPATASAVPTAQPTVEPSPVSTATAAPTSVPTAEPTMAPTLAPASPIAGPTAAPLECATGEPWTQSQGGVSLSLCFEPHPPELGQPGRFSALLVDEAGQPIAEATLNMLIVMLKRLTITGSTLRPRSHEEKAAIGRSVLNEVWPLIEQGRVKPIVDSTFSIAKTAEAHARMAGSTHIGKILLTP